ncbi:MarR family winged helix-turn-helix transcriptional regulator [Agromyces soli]|uniref:MarR family transcriptional regulator n=1 Tax=Agromyces soli TaxID=659012 RepID=A0ABY4ARH4_9MICO|nr:MarR family transcriptional regulator [Agromyces soli]UOE25718.1 MarR family transcriptional regulator [Agromyces soli]
MNVTILDRLLQIGELFQHDMARAFAGTGLTSARVRVLWVLQHSGPMTQQALASALEVSPRNVTGLVDALEASGHVHRAPHPNDRRAVLVELSATAEQTMAQMQRDHAALSATLLDAVDPGERAAVERGVAAIADRLAVLVAEAREAES